jgi:hypothetical protein
MASGRAPAPIGVFASYLYKPSVTSQELVQDDSEPPTLTKGADSAPIPTDPEVMEIKDDPAIGPDPLLDWRIPYLDYLVRGALTANKTKARHLACRAKSFVQLDRELYKRSSTGILQHCIPSV